MWNKWLEWGLFITAMTMIVVGFVVLVQNQNDKTTVEVTYDASGSVVALYYPPHPVRAPNGEFYTVFTSEGAQRCWTLWPEEERLNTWLVRERRLALTVSPEMIRQAQERHEADAILSYIGYDEDGGSI